MKRFLYLLMIPFLLGQAPAFAESCKLSRIGGDVLGVRAEIRGHYTSSFEHSGITPCGGEEGLYWWIESINPEHTALLQSELKKLGGSKYEAAQKRLYLRVEACLSPQGSYGHLGSYPHHAEIIIIKEYHPESDSDCS